MKAKWSFWMILGLLLINVNILGMVIGQAYDTDYSEATLVIGRDMRIPVFESGTEARLQIPLENIGQRSARNAVVEPIIESLENFPFEIDKMTMKKKKASIHGQTREYITFYLKVPLNVEEKMYPIKLHVEYDSDGKRSFTETVYVKIVNKYKQPSLMLNKVDISNQKLYSGKTNKIKLEFRNSSDLELKDIKVQFEGLSADKIMLHDYQNERKIKNLPSKHFATVLFKLDVADDLETGTYELDLVMNYKDQYDKQYTEKTKLYLPVEGGEGQTLNFSFDKLNYPTEGIFVNEDFEISFDLRNVGQEDAQDVHVSVEPGEEILPKSASIQSIGKLAAGESVPLKFILFAKEGTQSKNYPIKIVITYKTNTAKDIEKTMYRYVGVYIKEHTGESDNPKVIIDQYTYDGEYVKAGEQFPLILSFFNTNKGHAVKNIKVSLSSDEQVFSPVGSSNSFFIEQIPAGTKTTRTIMLKPKVDAPYKTYNVTAEITYEDGSGNKYTANEVIGIPVVQEIRLVTSEVKIPNEIFVGNSVGLTIDFYNMGRSLIRNMMVHTQGDFQINDSSLYIGNLEAGQDNYYDVTVIPQKEGTLDGKIVFEYDDEVGNHYTTEKVFTINATKFEPPIPDPSMEMNQVSKSSSTKGWVKIVIVLLVCALWIGRKIYKKKKKQKEEVAIDE